MSEEIERDEQMIDPDQLTETITVTVDGQEIDFTTTSTPPTTTISIASMQRGEGGGQTSTLVSELMEHDHVVMPDEVVIKTEIDDTGKPVLPPIPFSFPGQTFDTKCQKLILNVWDFFKKVKKNPDILDEIRTPQERAAAALHISAATIGKIGKNLKRTGKLETPGKKRKRTRPIVDSVSTSDEEIIKQIIIELRQNKQNPPTLPIVLAEARNRIGFSGGATSFRRILQRMGFKNLSQKNVGVKTKVTPINQEIITTNNSSSIFMSPLKVIKKEPVNYLQQQTSSISGQKNISLVNVASPSSSSNGTTTIGGGNSSTITLTSANNIQSGNVFHIAQGGVTLTQENMSALANAVQLSGQAGTQTLHVLGPDNTLRPIQIVYTNHIQ